MAAALGSVSRWSLAAGVVGLMGQQCLFVVDAGHRAVMFDRLRGVLPDVLGEGLHFKWPVLQKPTQYEVRTRAYSVQTQTGSKDLQQVALTLRVLFKPETAKLTELHKTLGTRFADRVLPSVGNEVLKSVVAQFDAGELITQREEVSRQVRDEFQKRADKFQIEVNDISITELHFSREFTKAIEMKQVEQQRAEKAKFEVHKAEQERNAAVIKATGEAQAAQLIRTAIESDPGFIQLRRIEAARDIAEELSRSRNVVYLPSGNGMLLNVGV